MTVDRRDIDDAEPEGFTYDSLAVALALLRAFADPERREVEGMDLAQLLLEENEPIRAVEALADVASAALVLIGRSRNVDINATLSALALQLATQLIDKGGRNASVIAYSGSGRFPPRCFQ